MRKTVMGLRIEELYPFLLANCGTGISINLIQKDFFKHLSGTPLGGASFTGFCKQMEPNKDYNQIMQSLDEYYEKRAKEKKCQSLTFQNALLDSFYERN